MLFNKNKDPRNSNESIAGGRRNGELAGELGECGVLPRLVVEVLEFDTAIARRERSKPRLGAPAFSELAQFRHDVFARLWRKLVPMRGRKRGTPFHQWWVDTRGFIASRKGRGTRG